MKTIFSRRNRGKNTLYILFAVATLTFAASVFLSHMLPQNIFLLIFIISIIAMVLLGGLVIQMRSGPPW